VYGGQAAVPQQDVPPLEWIGFNGGLAEFGYGGEGFCYDNELPCHKQHVEPYELASRLVTIGEWLEFMAAGGYETPELWLSDGAAWLEKSGAAAPGYWEQRDGEWWHYTLAGWRRVAESEPVCHISLYEADAYANWRGARLPTEYEWELAARDADTAGNFADSRRFHPAPLAGDGQGLSQLYGDVWEWTRSQYAPYPGFKPLSGALGEYNGKFMCDQFVLRGGSCATSPGHIRPTYRNFFAAPSRWQFTGLRLAKDAS
jgi:ergothioneine biosynthesis protein EgtB